MSREANEGEGKTWSPLSPTLSAGKEADTLRQQNPYFAVDTIAAGTYKDVAAVQTLAVGAQWVTSAKADTETVYQITRALFSDATQKALQAGHAKGKYITKENAVKGAGIPFHPGAERFYKEAGLLNCLESWGAPAFAADAVHPPTWHDR